MPHTSQRRCCCPPGDSASSTETSSSPQSCSPCAITSIEAKWKSRYSTPGRICAMPARCAFSTRSCTCRCTALKLPDGGTVRVTSAVYSELASTPMSSSSGMSGSTGPSQRTQCRVGACGPEPTIVEYPTPLPNVRACRSNVPCSQRSPSPPIARGSSATTASNPVDRVVDRLAELGDLPVVLDHPQVRQRPGRSSDGFRPNRRTSSSSTDGDASAPSSPARTAVERRQRLHGDAERLRPVAQVRATARPTARRTPRSRRTRCRPAWPAAAGRASRRGRRRSPAARARRPRPARP